MGPIPVIPGDVCFGAVREREVKSMSARDANVTEGIWHLPTTKPRLLFGWFHSGGRRRDRSCIKRDNKLIWQNG